jgi:hypothetical protein
MRRVTESATSPPPPPCDTGDHDLVDLCGLWCRATRGGAVPGLRDSRPRRERPRIYAPYLGAHLPNLLAAIPDACHDSARAWRASEVTRRAGKLQGSPSTRETARRLCPGPRPNSSQAPCPSKRPSMLRHLGAVRPRGNTPLHSGHPSNRYRRADPRPGSGEPSDKIEQGAN